MRMMTARTYCGFRSSPTVSGLASRSPPSPVPVPVGQCCMFGVRRLSPPVVGGSRNVPCARGSQHNSRRSFIVQQKTISTARTHASRSMALNAPSTPPTSVQVGRAHTPPHKATKCKRCRVCRIRIRYKLWQFHKKSRIHLLNQTRAAARLPPVQLWPRNARGTRWPC